ncbi:MAG: hypothetical protein Rhirs2KO_32240 [Rhizobiaceae bacterium]
MNIKSEDFDIVLPRFKSVIRGLGVEVGLSHIVPSFGRSHAVARLLAGMLGSGILVRGERQLPFVIVHPPGYSAC